MKLSRVILVCTMLLFAAYPSFAAPPCSSCFDGEPCTSDPNSGLRCKFTNGVCNTIGSFCIGFVDTTMLAEWSVASIEISQPAQGTKVVTAPAVVASADIPTAEPPSAEPALQK
jgi:hypothetical protein